MFDFLDRLRGKPEEYRKMVALISVGIIGGLIFIAWMFTTLSRIPEANKQFRDTKEEITSDFKEKVKFEDNATALRGFAKGLKDILLNTVESAQNLQTPIEYKAGEPD